MNAENTQSVMANALLRDAKLLELSPDDIDDGGRIGFVHEDKAAAIGRLMAVDGQRDPIKVFAQAGKGKKPWRLVTGMHRLIGARLEGLTVFAIEVSGQPEDLADLEASENLHRRPLQPIERAKFTAALVAAAQARVARVHGDISQQQVAIKARWDRVKSGEVRAENALTEEVGDTCATIAHVYGWEESVGEALGMSRRTIHNDLSLYRLVIEPFAELAEALSKHPVVGENAAQLKAIAQVRDEGQRRKVIDLLLADSELSADEARVQAGIDRADNGPAPAPYQKFNDQIISGWDRLNLTARRAFLPTLAGMIGTPEMKRDLRDMLTRELGEHVAGTLKPVVPIRASVKPSYIVCLEDGTRHQNLTAHLNRIGMTPGEYRARWDLPRDYPMLAPDYTAARRTAWQARVRKLRAAMKREGGL